MVQGPSLEVMDAIRDASSADEQINALKQLKNDIVGHDQRKELVVRQGIIEPLVNILSSASKASGKRRAGESNGAWTQHSWTPEEEARLQATLILGSLANGGSAFVQPLLAAGTTKHLLDTLAGETSPRLVTATLQALRSLAAAAHSEGKTRDQTPLNLFSTNVEPIFREILCRAQTTSAAKQQLKLAIEIITLSATNNTTRSDLANSGLLTTLASLLASHAIAHKQFDLRGLSRHHLPPPPITVLPNILAAITAILTGSNFRVQSFILSTPIRELFPPSYSDNSDRYSFASRPGMTNAAAESPLPAVYVPTYKSVSFNGGSSAFPALGTLQPAGNRVAGAGFDVSQHGNDVEHANAVCGWLIVLARSMQGLSRLVALRLLALVNNAIEADSLLAPQKSETLQRARERERYLAMLAVPLVVKLVQSASEGLNGESILEERDSKEVKEQACEVLALLIKGSKELQAAAVDAGAIKRVCLLLKKSFDNVPVARPMWSAKSKPQVPSDAPESCRMGSRGLPTEIHHALRCRQSTLEALAALAKKEDIHRKAIVEAGVVNCIIDSLEPFPVELLDDISAKRTQITTKDGNTSQVILAACRAAKSMSRSVSLLRTSLIDAGIARPTYELLMHQDPEVQVAATDVCCNLLLEFSPMREDLIAAGVIRTLTEHARQSETGLRLGSLWALKHLVLSSPKEVKVQCLEELGTGWLVGAIQGEQREAGALSATGGVSIGAAGGLSTPNAAGEQVDLLNPASMDVDDPPEDDRDIEEDDDEDGEIMYDEASSTHYQASQLRSTLNPPIDRASSPPFNSERYLSSVRELEQNPALQAKRDDIAVQEQALDFIRNMLNGEDCAVMFEHLLSQIGVEKIFTLLTDKLAPVTNRSGRQTHHPTELILSTIHVLTHIANGSPRHKQLLIAQKPLLANWLPHFNHPDRRVRVICVWAVNSLTWIEDDADRPGALRRARELRVCGIEAAVRGLSNDGDLDVRERVRTAVRQLDGL
ncbi:hypothetical protein LTR37_015831 [Vermiconidia calcicola]|uniref:Uncharacterized protein n=1 Tax=Vermiconidia calcicola TaxID=1690605 RepID=A0ACC3MQC9_9PEZI|nr:hypothetical protein LTR37_015831 [Vermiconidia calcicola]